MIDIYKAHVDTIITENA